MQFDQSLEMSRKMLPGVLVSATLGMAAAFISENLGGPTLIYALLLGMAFNFLSQGTTAAPGIQYTSRTILRLGVALLGVRISFGQITDLGAIPIAIIISSVTATIIFGRQIAAPLGLSPTQGILMSGAVAICGASAALAISAVLPANKDSERDTLFTVIAVTILSTVAMVLYPILIRLMSVDHNVAGIIIGGTIHDVAQVVGAGYLISPETGIVSTYIKLLRVTMLMPVVMVLVWMYRDTSAGTSALTQPLLPSFLAGFAALVIANSLGLIPTKVADTMGLVSRCCLVSAIAALGMKTSLQQIAKLGWRPLAMIVAATLFLLVLVLAELKLARLF
jgi:uncharacterized integral membrane protein (TIGR00698 family)